MRGTSLRCESLFPLLYPTLSRLANRELSKERAGHTLQTTALVNEAFIELPGQRRVHFETRGHFLAVAAFVMRRISTQHARSRAAVKRGGGNAVLTLQDPDSLEIDAGLAEITAVDAALNVPRVGRPSRRARRGIAFLRWPVARGNRRGARDFSDHLQTGVGSGEGVAQAGVVAIVSIPADWLELKREMLELLEQPESDRAATLVRIRTTAPQRAAALEQLIQDAESEFLGDSCLGQCRGAGTLGEAARTYRAVEDRGRSSAAAEWALFLRGERDDGSFQQTVAVKLIRAELVSGELRRRFDSERRILASLDHPNVARLLDAGTTEQGIPYLVLEYVRGRTLDAYCDALSLDIAQRLALLRLVCAAVHAAHQRLILHRDLKTANVLVDGAGQPKLLDFGIAKLLVPDTQQDDVARVGFARPLTPE